MNYRKVTLLYYEAIRLVSDLKASFGFVLFLCFVFFGFFGLAFAQSITLTPSATSVAVDTLFGLTVQVTGISNPGEVQIQGIDKFTVRRQAQSTSIQVINGQQSLQFELQLQLQPSASGSFVIGPARMAIGTGELVSNSVTLVVTGEKLFLQPTQVNTLLGTAEKVPDEEAVQVLPKTFIPKSNNSSRWRLLVIVGLLLLGFFFARRKKYTKVQKSNLCEKEVLNKYIALPSEDATDFREQMDRRWRMHLFGLLGKDCFSSTYSELSLLIDQFPQKTTQEFFLRAFQLIQQARYANSEVNRQEIIMLADRFLSSR